MGGKFGCVGRENWKRQRDVDLQVLSRTQGWLKGGCGVEQGLGYRSTTLSWRCCCFYKKT